jgi:hypothetical protein
VQAAIDLYGAGWSLARIGEPFGCHHSVVLRALQRAGVPRAGWSRPGLGHELCADARKARASRATSGWGCTSG